MTKTFGLRAARVAAFFCALAALGGAPVARGGEERGPAWVRPEGLPEALVMPPTSEASKGGKPLPVTVMLHGMCDLPQNECPYFYPATKDGSFLVCPRATMACDGGGAIWSGSSEKKAQALDRTLAAVRAAYPGEVAAPVGDTLVGFSMGASVAAELATREPFRWKALVLIASKVSLDANKLKAAGVQRVVLASGDLDQSKPAMQRMATTLAKQGVEARFVSLGRVGHTFPSDMTVRMSEILQWATKERGGA